MQYSDLTTALGELMVVTITNSASATPSNDTNFNNILPRIITDAEQRIYRELDFLATRQSVFEANALANTRVMSIPDTTIVLQGANILTNMNVMSQTPAYPASFDNILFNYTINSNLIEITDNNPNVPLIVNDQWINVLTAIETDNTMSNPILQGPQQIVSINLTTPGSENDFFIQGSSTASINPLINGNLYNLSTVTGSTQVIVFTVGTYTQVSVGSIITIGISTVMGPNGTVIAAGDYVVTSITGPQTFTFNLPTAALDTATIIENNDTPAIQYLAYPLSGTKNRVEIVSKDAMDILWPTDLSEQGIPKYAAFIDNQTLALGPVPDQNYIVEFTGVFRPAPMSATNTTTYLGTTYPDLFLAACIVFGMLYQKDADQPQGAPPGQDMQKWEAVYKERKVSAMEEIARQKGQSTNWSNYQQTPLSTPPRP